MHNRKLVIFIVPAACRRWAEFRLCSRVSGVRGFADHGGAARSCGEAVYDGLILVPAGVWRCSKRRGGLRNIPSVDVTGPAAIRFFGLLGLLTVINVAIVSAGTYTSVKYMDSQQFCGRVCHVMIPQYTAYQD